MSAARSFDCTVVQIQSKEPFIILNTTNVVPVRDPELLKNKLIHEKTRVRSEENDLCGSGN